MRFATYLQHRRGAVDEDFISRRRFAIFEGSDRGITMSVVTRVAAIAALLLAAACSNEPQILEPDPTTSTSTASTAAPMPSAARERSESGAVNFVSYWFEISDRAALTGDVAELRRISAPNCKTCAEFIDLYSDTYESGGSFTGGRQSLSEVTAETSSNAKAVLVSAALKLDEGTFKKDAKSKPERVRAETNKITARVDWTGSGWRLSELVRNG